MRIIITVFSVIAIGFGSLFDNNYLIRPNEIIWSDSVKLTWENFGGLTLPNKNPKLEIKLKDSEKIRFLALTVTDIVCNKEGSGYNVKSVFYAGQSYYKADSDDLRPFAQILRHELYHFHITELQARYMRRNITELIKLSREINIDELLKKYKHNLDSAGTAYDKFTRHGIERQNQISFENTVDSLLFETAIWQRPMQNKNLDERY